MQSKIFYLFFRIRYILFQHENIFILTKSKRLQLTFKDIIRDLRHISATIIDVKKMPPVSAGKHTDI